MMIVGVAVVLALVGIAAAGVYNGLVRARNQVENGWAQIDVQLKRRADLVPNLVQVVKGYAAHEATTLQAVTAARSAGLDAETPQEAAAADGPLVQALGQLLAVSEAYPELQADESFRELQAELTATEDRIGFARQFYNDSVNRYHDRIRTFPGVMLARATGFGPCQYFEAPAGTGDVTPVEI